MYTVADEYVNQITYIRISFKFDVCIYLCVLVLLGARTERKLFTDVNSAFITGRRGGRNFDGQTLLSIENFQNTDLVKYLPYAVIKDFPT